MTKIEYPYQIVAFLDSEPEQGEQVYNGNNGWYPQIALKRRFRLAKMSEDELFYKVSRYVESFGELIIKTGKLTKPERMPVSVVEVKPDERLINFHTGLLSVLADSIESKYPEREGDNYLPHITAEYDGKVVIDPTEYTDREYSIDKVWILKDVRDEDSLAYKKI